MVTSISLRRGFFCQLINNLLTSLLGACALNSRVISCAHPGIPTIASSGISGTKDFDVAAWQSLVAPAGTPKEIINNYSQLVARIMQDPKLRSELELEGIEPRFMASNTFGPFIENEAKRWGAAVRSSGAVAD